MCVKFVGVEKCCKIRATLVVFLEKAAVIQPRTSCLGFFGKRGPEWEYHRV